MRRKHAEDTAAAVDAAHAAQMASSGSGHARACCFYDARPAHARACCFLRRTPGTRARALFFTTHARHTRARAVFYDARPAHARARCFLRRTPGTRARVLFFTTHARHTRACCVLFGFIMRRLSVQWSSVGGVVFPIVCTTPPGVTATTSTKPPRHHVLCAPPCDVRGVCPPSSSFLWLFLVWSRTGRRARRRQRGRRGRGASQHAACAVLTHTRHGDTHVYRETLQIRIGCASCQSLLIIRNQLAHVTDLERMRIINNE